jgi:hypothetical protein
MDRSWKTNNWRRFEVYRSLLVPAVQKVPLEAGDLKRVAP